MENTTSTTRWTIKVSADTDSSLRAYLAQHGAKKGDLSKFVEEAVRWRVLDKTVNAVRKRNAVFADAEMETDIDVALNADRAKQSTRKSGK